VGFTSQDTPHGYWNYCLEATSISSITAALKPSFLLSNLASSDFVPSTVFPTRGYRGATPSVPYIGDAISALYWRRLILATPLLLGDASSSFLRPLTGSHHIFDFDYSQRPGTGWYSIHTQDAYDLQNQLVVKHRSLHSQFH